MASANGPVERKTTIGAVGTYLLSLGALGLVQWLGKGNLFDSVPDAVEVFIAPILPALASFLVSYSTAHRPGQLSQSARQAAAGQSTNGL